jgi:hypothetical protein
MTLTTFEHPHITLCHSYKISTHNSNLILFAHFYHAPFRAQLNFILFYRNTKNFQKELDRKANTAYSFKLKQSKDLRNTNLVASEF